MDESTNTLPPGFPALTLREAHAGDENLILKSWLMSYASAKCGDRAVREDALGSDQMISHGMFRDRYYAGQQKVIHALTMNPELGRRTLMVVDADAPDIILGFAVGKLDHKADCLVMDFVYVKHAYRKHGLARELLKGLGWTPGVQIVATHWTRVCGTKQLKYNILFDDYLLKIGNV